MSVSGAANNTHHLPLFKNNGNLSQVSINDTTYFNIDGIDAPIVPTSLRESDNSRFLSLPHPASDAANTQIIQHATSLDSESKLIDHISRKYPGNDEVQSLTVFTALPPCDSCAIILKEFGHERGAEQLNVLWGKRPGKRKASQLSGASTSSGSSGASSASNTSRSSTTSSASSASGSSSHEKP